MVSAVSVGVFADFDFGLPRARVWGCSRSLVRMVVEARAGNDDKAEGVVQPALPVRSDSFLIQASLAIYLLPLHDCLNRMGALPEACTAVLRTKHGTAVRGSGSGSECIHLQSFDRSSA